MKFRYQVNERLPIREMVLFSLQWFLITVPMIIIMGKVGASFHYPQAPELQLIYMEKLFFTTGLVMVAQLLWGHGLPIVVGPASVLLIGIVASGAAVSEQVVYFSIAMGGLGLVLLAATGFLTPLSRLFTTRVVGVVLLLIAFTFLPTVVNLLTANSVYPFGQLVFAGCMLSAMLTGQRMLPEILRSTMIIWALLLGSLAYQLLFSPTLSPVVRSGTGVSWELMSVSFAIDPAVLISFLFCYVALLINELGSVQTTAKLVAVPDAAVRSKRGVIATGLGNILAGLWGVIGPVSYSLSTGMLIATGCASRYPLILAAMAVVGLAFVPTIIDLFSYIPPVVIGTMLFYMLCSQISGSFALLSPVMVNYTFDTGLILGVPVMLGVVVAFLPVSVTNSIPELWRPLLSNGFIVGVTVALIMEHILLKKS